MVQAAVLDGLLFDAPPLNQNGFAPPEAGVSRGEVADALVVSVVVVGIDEGFDRRIEFAFEEVVFEENAVLAGLAPAFDLALGPMDASARRGRVSCLCPRGIWPDRRRCRTIQCR